ncbi:unnamed protein product [Clonostachys rosea]|uniref:Ankyrin repeat protein n=1 Tax=Bionectria ochroleuca TaxID=29856 RepID=A0ABY6TQH4_BIOOC|nr:unnamed protein product [Clonostachys rosea]
MHDLVGKPSTDQDAPNFLQRNKKDKKHLRYLHFPANNMKWVEDVMSLYFRDSETDSEQNIGHRKRTPSSTVLRNEYWKGRMHGSHESSIHARHLRPLCELVSSNPEEAEQSPRNVVLFMPILHWDTDRKAQTFSKVIDNLVGVENRDIERRERKAAEIRREDRKPKQPAKPGESKQPEKSDESKQPAKANTWDTVRNIDTLPGAVMAYSKKYPLRKSKNLKLTRDKFGRLLFSKPLAQLLYDASKLVEEMDNYRDKMMLQKYLHHQSPMHPRRTLDQAYYHSVKSTRTRDRDQVVYRETTPREDALHQWKTEGGKVLWNCNERGDFPKTNTASFDVPNLDARRYKILNRRCYKCASAKRHTENWKGDIKCPPENEDTSEDEEQPKDKNDQKEPGGHGCKFCKSQVFGCSCRPIEFHDEHGVLVKMEADSASAGGLRCPRCLENIRKLSRLIMVDQLWMWILDENTILTFFPKRYGVNKQDASGVHKSIRERVERARNNQIKTVYDLALIILNECTRTIFDETKTKDRRPAVLDIFSRAIGRVTHKQTLAFNHMWESAEKLRRVSLAPDSQQHANLSELHIPLLNITPEGMLQKEIRDILDELGIMLHLVNEQKRVIEKFIANVSTIIVDGKDGAQSRDSDKPSPSQWFEKSAKRLLADTDSRLRELEGLKGSANSTSEALDYLLSLKQQQASIIQAWQSIRHGEEAVKQGRAIMVFTTMTILFLPAAFIAGVFGMNNPELDPDPGRNKKPVTIAFQLQIMFGVTAGIILLVCVLAFSAFVRTFLWSIYREGTTWILIRFGIYRFWLRWGQNWSSDNRWKVTEYKVREQKSNERSAARKRFAREVEATKRLMAIREKKKARRKVGV